MPDQSFFGFLMRPKIVKFCGITRPADAQICIDLGADALGFIFHPQSPRNLSVPEFKNLVEKIKFNSCARVGVAVDPELSLVKSLLGAGIEKFQFHFASETPIAKIEEWSALVGRENLWLAPRLKPEEDLPEGLLDFADVFLMDAYAKDAYGGTGRQSDWGKFSRFKKQYGNHQWILAGGLGPDNLRSAISSTHPDGIDLNSGVEFLPGKKDADKIKDAFAVLG